MKRVAIIGTMGVPAKYGGFETLVENIIGENASGNIEYTVFCSSISYDERPERYKGARLCYLPIKANGAQSTLYDVVSMLCCLRGYDTVVILGVSGCLFLPVFRLLFRKRLVVNIDGLEHRRAKWGKFAKKFLWKSEQMAVKYADVVIADNPGIADYVTNVYHRTPTLIAYGGDHAMREVSAERQQEILQRFGLKANGYAFTVCRIEPENNCHVTLQAFAQSGMPLLFVGNFDHSAYAQNLRRDFARFPNIKIVDAIYDLEVLYALRANCRWYIHGHSAGGTNPSLVEAMHFGRTVFAFDCVYNRATTYDRAFYWNSTEQLKQLIADDTLGCGAAMQELAQTHYTWKKIASQYEAVYFECSVY